MPRFNFIGEAFAIPMSRRLTTDASSPSSPVPIHNKMGGSISPMPDGMPDTVTTGGQAMDAWGSQYQPGPMRTSPSAIRARTPDMTGAMPSGDPSSTTTGATSGAGLHVDQIGEWEANPQFFLYLKSTPAGAILFRKMIESGQEESIGGPYQINDGQQFHLDQSESKWRLWRVRSGTLDLGETWTGRQRTVPQSIPTDPTYGDTGMIRRPQTTGDGIRRGQRNAALVARRVAPLKALNEANRRFWAR
jgi:hypothetical protein